jgi:hypothetical protein
MRDPSRRRQQPAVCLSGGGRRWEELPRTVVGLVLVMASGLGESLEPGACLTNRASNNRFERPAFLVRRPVESARRRRSTGALAGQDEDATTVDPVPD